ncbi:MAG: phosphatase PAP2 family protein [Bacillota bacterium]|nr:phosphatase PAP2 family protein [Bacillota bacterium]
MTGSLVFEFFRSIATPGLDKVVKVVTDLGSVSFYMIAIPIIYWCVNKSLGFSLGMITSISSYINVGLKFIFKIPRPYVAYPHLDAPDYLLNTGTGWSFPSGHAQGTSTFWAYSAWQVKRAWFTALSVIIVAVVGLTRVYATVHYPTDVLVGTALGLIIVQLYMYLEHILAQRKTRISVGTAVAASIVIPGVAFALSSISFELARESASLLGFTMGLGVGYALEKEYVKYDVRACLLIQVVKVLWGLAVLMGIRYGLKAILPEGSFWQMLRYAVMALWGTYGAPLMFKAVFNREA